MIYNENVEKVNNRLKRLNIKTYFYNGNMSGIFILLRATPELIKELGYKHIKCTEDIKDKLDEEDDTIPDIDKWISDYKISISANKYNL